MEKLTLSKKELKEVNKLMAALIDLVNASNALDDAMDNFNAHQAFTRLSIFFELGEGALSAGWYELGQLVEDIPDILDKNDLVGLVKMYNRRF